MKFTVKLNILNKEFNIKNIEAENEYSAENKAIYYIIIALFILKNH